MTDRLAELISRHRFDRMEYGTGNNYHTRYEVCVCGDVAADGKHAAHVAEVIREAHTITTPAALAALPVGTAVITHDQLGFVNRTGPGRSSRKFFQYVGAYGYEVEDNPNTWTDVYFPAYAVPGYLPSWGEDDD